MDMSANTTGDQSLLDSAIEKVFLITLFVIPFPIAMRNIFIWLLILLYLVNKIVKKDLSLPKTEFNIYIGIFLLFSILSLYKAVDFSNSVNALFSPILRYAIFFFIAMELIDKDKIMKYINIILISNSLIIIYGLYLDYFTDNDFFYRANSRATFSVFVVVIFLTFLFDSKFKLYKKLLFMLVISGSVAAVVTTYSRGGVLGFIAGIAFFSLLLIWKGLKKEKLIAILLIIILFSPLLLSANLMARFERMKDFESDGSISTRLTMFESSLLMMRDNPLLGIGVGNFEPKFSYYLDEVLEEDLSASARAHDHPHNLFFYVGAEQGIISLIILLIMFFKAYKLCLFNYINFQRGKLINSIALASLAMLTSLVVHSFVDTPLRRSYVGLYMILFIIFNMKLLTIEGEEDY